MAVNGTKISTYGQRTVTIRPKGAKIPYQHVVLLAELDEPILGWQFLVDFKLDIRWKRGKCILVDSMRRENMPLKLSTVEERNLGLALVTFRQYAQQRTEESGKTVTKPPIPSDYLQILNEYPKVQEINFKTGFLGYV